MKAMVLDHSARLAPSAGCPLDLTIAVPPRSAFRCRAPLTAIDGGAIDQNHLARGSAPRHAHVALHGRCTADAEFVTPGLAGKKQVEGVVPGAAEVLLFPDLTSANLTVKAIMYTADCRFGGVLCGAVCPVVFMSRADTTATCLHCLALALRLIAVRGDGAILSRSR